MSTFSEIAARYFSDMRKIMGFVKEDPDYQSKSQDYREMVSMRVKSCGNCYALDRPADGDDRMATCSICECVIHQKVKHQDEFCPKLRWGSIAIDRSHLKLDAVSKLIPSNSQLNIIVIDGDGHHSGVSGSFVSADGKFIEIKTSDEKPMKIGASSIVKIILPTNTSITALSR